MLQNKDVWGCVSKTLITFASWVDTPPTQHFMYASALGNSLINNPMSPILQIRGEFLKKTVLAFCLTKIVGQNSEAKNF